MAGVELCGKPNQETENSPVLRPSLDGVVLVDKPAGCTSHDVVNRCRRIFGTRKVGHAGTLDPMATGVLVVCIGQATRIVEYLAAHSKVYAASALFGLETSTQDTTGDTVRSLPAHHITVDNVLTAIAQFTGAIEQIPPMVSAVHHKGRRLYEYARAGVEVEREPRCVTVHSLELVGFTAGERPTAQLLVDCSPGTYIRTLIADIGAAMGVGGAMTALRRTQSGNFTINQCVQLDDLLFQQCPSYYLVTIAAALSTWRRAVLDLAGEADVRMGRTAAPLEVMEPPHSCHLATPDQPALMVGPAGEAVGLAKLVDGSVVPFKVFAPRE